MLESRNLTKKFGTKTAVDHVSIKLSPGHVYAMLGPNGSGKTTWMKMAAGLTKPTSGEVLFNNSPLSVKDRAEIAYMSTEPYFYNWMTIRSVGKYYQDFFRDFSMDRYREFLSRMDLTEDLKVKSLSTGMMAKLKIAVTMARKAKVIMLDEPLNGIDLLARDEITKTILESASPDLTLLISTHLVEELENVADYAVFMKESHLVEFREIEEMRRTDGKSIVDRYREIYGHQTQEA